MKVHELLTVISEGYVSLESDVVVVRPSENRAQHYPVAAIKRLNLCQWEDPSPAEAYLVLEIGDRPVTDDLAGRR